jgi:hypothetical protein
MTFSCGSFFFLSWHYSLLKTARPEQLFEKVLVSPGVSSSSNVYLLFPTDRDKSIPIGRYLHISGSYSVCDLFFRFGGGRPHHNVQSLIFRNSTEDLAIHFAISSLNVFPKIRPAVFSFLSHSCHLVPLSLIPPLRSSFG